MRTEEEIRKELKEIKHCLKDREAEDKIWLLKYGYIMALEWVLEAEGAEE